MSPQSPDWAGTAAWRPQLIGAIYLAVTFAVFGATLDDFFMSDDFYFLGLVTRAHSPLVLFEPLADRFIRPFVVAVYYAGYHTMGLTPWPYHLAVLFAHALTSWLIYLTAARMAGPDATTWAFLAGLLFLVFGGHGEAVAWVAGAADPLLAAAIVGALLCYIRAVELDAQPIWLAGFFAVTLLAMLAKETWVMLPGLLLAHTVTFGVPPGAPRRRAVIAIGGATVLVAGYLVARVLVFGSVAGGLAGLGTSLTGVGWTGQLRAFLLRCFVAPGSVPANLWLSGRDVWIWPLALGAIAWSARGRSLRMIVFSALATGAALVPVLPLTISIAGPESERFVYLATAFSSTLLVWTVRTVLRTRALAIVVCAAMIALHVDALLQANQVRQQAALVSRGVIDSFADHAAVASEPIFILNLPDNLRGVYVSRVGFHDAIEIVRPEVRARTRQTIGIASHTIGSPADAARLTRPGPRTFALDFGANGLLQSQIPSSPQYRITAQTPTSYAVEFTGAVRHATVLYFTAGRLELAGIVD